jgi:hypothetical protein
VNLERPLIAVFEAVLYGSIHAACRSSFPGAPSSNPPWPRKGEAIIVKGEWEPSQP